MEYLLNKVQKEYGFSDYQIRLLRFSFTGILYDVSKTLIFFIFFYLTGKLPEFLFAVVPLILLRTRTGGIHFRKYWTCFVFSFIYLLLAVYILPESITMHPLMVYPILLICAVTDYLIGPSSLKDKAVMRDALLKEVQNGRLRKVKMESFQVVLVVAILYFLVPGNQYLIVSFWTVVLHTVQLVITMIMKEVKRYEKVG